MSVSLEKKSHAEGHAPVEKLEFVSINLSWGARSRFGTEFDLDLSCFLLNGDGKVGAETDFVFYNNPASACGSSVYSGDNRVGEWHELDSETINIDLPKLKDEVERAVIVATIHEADKRNQVFGFVSDSRVEVINRKNSKLLAAYNLGEAFRDEAAVIICEFFRSGKGWKFRSLNREYMGDLSEIAKNFGIELD